MSDIVLFELLLPFMKELPQEWLVVVQERKTCQSKNKFIRIETEPKVSNNNERLLVCVIVLDDNILTIITPRIGSAELVKVVGCILRNSCIPLTIKECKFECENCAEVWALYH